MIKCPQCGKELDSIWNLAYHMMKENNHCGARHSPDCWCGYKTFEISNVGFDDAVDNLSTHLHKVESNEGIAYHYAIGCLLQSNGVKHDQHV